MMKDYEFHEVYEASSQMTALGALMMAMDNDAIELTDDEIHGIGVLLNSIGMGLREWNKKNGKEYEEKQKYAFDPSLRWALRQYLDIKKQYHGAIILFDGASQDHYYCLFGDAYHVSDKLGLELKFYHEDLPKCVVPADLRDKCVEKMIDFGMKVAVCGQELDKEAINAKGKTDA